ncbi:hypothetical protein NDU88_007560 [Pleurodeles waltl]|uniref:Uncharacterized protein n=1 Tax=Pleurodeles waltl TaxID=8319 RepID=A0AAV7RTE3_PLEWA|nr:hypothetical protein NDU88_007560 [Pleurodeles waltl]
MQGCQAVSAAATSSAASRVAQSSHGVHRGTRGLGRTPPLSPRGYTASTAPALHLSLGPQPGAPLCRRRADARPAPPLAASPGPTAASSLVQPRRLRRLLAWPI